MRFVEQILPDVFLRARSRSPGITLACLTVLLISAKPPRTNHDEIRQANAAFEEGEFETADLLYTRAEEWAVDPGLIAFNKANVLYRQGSDRRAELCYRRCLADKDVPAERRVRALYGLGNSLVRQAGESDIKLLQSAIECYELCLRSTTDDGLRSDAGHNLEQRR